MTKLEGMTNIPASIEKAMAELLNVNQLIVSGKVEPHIVNDFRDALNRVRTAAWAASQYMARIENPNDSSNMLSFMAGERVRAAYHLCQLITNDLKHDDIDLQVGSLIQLQEAARTLSTQLLERINQ